MSFISKVLNEMEQNYEIHNKKMPGMIHCLKVWRHFLKGARVRFKIWTDHKNLEYSMTSQNLNCRQARWALYLSRFDFLLKYVPRTKMGKVDGLSRKSNWEKRTEGNNEEKMLLKLE